MTGTWKLLIYEQEKTVHTLEGTGVVELGRQLVGEPAPYEQKTEGGVIRCIIARMEEETVSRKHVRLEPRPNDRVRIINLSSKLPVLLDSRTEIAARKEIETSLPAKLTFGGRVFRMQSTDSGEGGSNPLMSLMQATIPPLADSKKSSLIARPPRSLGMEADQLFRWLHAAMGVLQGVAGSREFFPRAARAMVDLVGLDSGRVLLWGGEDWKVQAYECVEGRTPNPNWNPSRQVLQRLLEEKRTFWMGGKTPVSANASLAGVETVVAAPILNASGNVIGALYGDRRVALGIGSQEPISRLEALLVELLAGGVAAGLACLEQEQAAVRARVQFEQFFTPELSRQLESEPDLLNGRDSSITVLFCDIRHFSKYSERLGPARTVEWLGDVLGALSECVLKYHGVLVDYMGDELMAMWGAPAEQARQAELATCAARDMLALVPEMGAKWSPVLGGPMGLGVGINTGLARVGNMGTQRKFKYGPLGNTVNIASRVQGATKYLKAPVLITKETRDRLEDGSSTRRVCRVRVVNIQEPIELYELSPVDRPGWNALARAYEAALERFEHRDHEAAMRLLFQLLNEHPDDGPALVLLSRVIALRDADPGEFDPCWELPGK